MVLTGHKGDIFSGRKGRLEIISVLGDSDESADEVAAPIDSASGSQAEEPVSSAEPEPLPTATIAAEVESEAQPADEPADEPEADPKPTPRAKPKASKASPLPKREPVVEEVEVSYGRRRG